jgi:vanillate O-demethylase monooxygenase subunit
VAEPGSQPADLPVFAEVDNPAHHLYAGVPVTWSCGATRQIENFCDVAHFSVVHDDTFGNPWQLELGRYDVTHGRGGTGPGGHDIRAVLDYAGFDRSGGDETPTPITFEYRMELPFAVWLGSTYGTGPQRQGGVLFCVTRPISDEECCVYWVHAQAATAAPDDASLQRYETMIFEADRRLIESQVPATAPLDVTTEAHLPFDKLSIAYRRALIDLGFGSEDPATVETAVAVS